MSLVSIHPPTEISTRNISCDAKTVSVSNVMKSGNLELLEHSGTIQPCTGIALPFFLNIKWPFPIAPRSRAWVCDRSIAGIVGSNPVGGMVVSFL